jgi:hypothetical protein
MIWQCLRTILVFITSREAKHPAVRGIAINKELSDSKMAIQLRLKTIL